MKPMLSRRSFLKSSLVTTATLALPSRFWAQVPGANNDLRVAVVGFGGRGGSHISEFNRMAGVRIVALCDADSQILERGAKSFADKGKPVRKYTDYRNLLEDKEVD